LEWTIEVAMVPAVDESR